MKLRELCIEDLLRYYKSYNDIEKPILDAFKNLDSNEITKFQIAQVKNYMKYMKIHRVFINELEFNKKNNKDKYEEILVSITLKKNISDLNKIIHENKLFNSKITDSLVAASKLKFLINHETIILDNNVRKVLNLKENVTYNDFCNRWNEEYNNYESRINLAITELLKLNLAHKEILQEKWFKMRVFDQYLWDIYNKNQKI